MSKIKLIDGLLPGLPADRIRAAFAAAPGNEFGTEKFLSPESSAALAANAFGFFLDRPADLPPMPVGADLDWPAQSVALEVQHRFPWRGGRHPWLDATIETNACVIGIESKRYEPFRGKAKPAFSEAFERDVWGAEMGRYSALRDDLMAGRLVFQRLDAAQLVKHAYGLRTTVHRDDASAGKRPVLLYLYAEPAAWSDKRPVASADVETHRAELNIFGDRVSGDEVTFLALSYRDLLAAWASSGDTAIRDHAAAIAEVFKPQGA